jgi:catechol 2,3-dioxygenase-like lactoylglutathione lyase family enzyme
VEGNHAPSNEILDGPCSGPALGILSVNVRIRASHPPPAVSSVPKLMQTCLISSDLDKLVQFYEPVLQMKAKRSGPDYAEFSTAVGILAIFSAAAQEKYIPGSAESAKNKSSILEFQVANVDKEYSRLQPLVKAWVKPPTTQPWGTRSIYFRDPDGNLINFYAPVKSE